MEREIKFNAIDLSGNYIRNIGQIEFSTSGRIIINGEIPVKKLLQFTGHKDKNGCEICEGSIVNEFRMSRSFPEGRNVRRVIEWNDDMTLDDSFGEKAIGFNLFGGTLEVIGNIYENPELLSN